MRQSSYSLLRQFRDNEIWTLQGQEEPLINKKGLKTPGSVLFAQATSPPLHDSNLWMKPSTSSSPTAEMPRILCCCCCTDKKEYKIFLIYKEIQSGAVAKSYMRNGFLIMYTRNCANISPYMRRPLVIYDFATAPFWISLYMRKIWFSFLSVCCCCCSWPSTVQHQQPARITESLQPEIEKDKYNLYFVEYL